MTLSDLNLGWQLLSVIGGVILIAGWIIWSNVKYLRAKTVPVRRKSRLLSISERNLFDCLILALSDTYFIFSKVGIKHVIEQNPGASGLDVKRVDEDIRDQYFDFVLCRRDDMSIFGVVELEYADRGKGSIKRSKRNKLVNRLCKSANLKLFSFDVRQDYKSMDIARMVTGKSRQIDPAVEQVAGTHSTQLTLEEASRAIVTNIRNCPMCRSALVTKVALKGRSIGEKFLMCSHSSCDYRIAVSELDRLKKIEQEALESTTSEGFNNWT